MAVKAFAQVTDILRPQPRSVGLCRDAPASTVHDVHVGSTQGRTESQTHGVDFRKAATVFNDALSTTFPDVDHSVGERRFLIIGLSAADRILVVAHTEAGDTIRIIRARRATRREQRFYEEDESSAQ
jgi:uncharacterized DUF497 family protein